MAIGLFYGVGIFLGIGIGFYFYNAAKLFFCKVFKGYFPLPPLLESQKQRLFYAI